MNYDPRVRYQKSNLLLTFLMPPKIKTNSAQKFYRLLEEELNNLFYNGMHRRSKIKRRFAYDPCGPKGKGI